MDFNDHSDLIGQHAFLSASKYHWTNYNLEKVTDAYYKYLAIQKGTELHAFANHAIQLGIKLPKLRRALNMFVNDAIGFRMRSEQPLYYSPNAFGTADAISFRDSTLRIHDLKTGITPVSMRQLEVYASLFCLEYKYRPNNISIELRVYQGEDIIIHIPNKNEILEIMDKIVAFDKKIETIKLEAED